MPIPKLAADFAGALVDVDLNLDLDVDYPAAREPGE
jgi:hypothetical protein